MKEFNPEANQFHGERTDQAKLLSITEKLSMISAKLIRERGHTDLEVLPLEDLESLKKLVQECKTAINDYEKKTLSKRH